MTLLHRVWMIAVTYRMVLGVTEMRKDWACKDESICVVRDCIPLEYSKICL